MAAAVPPTPFTTPRGGPGGGAVWARCPVQDRCWGEGGRAGCEREVGGSWAGRLRSRPREPPFHLAGSITMAFVKSN